VRDAVKAVTAQAVFACELERNCVRARKLGKPGEKGSVEHGDLRDRRSEQRPARADSVEGERIMKRSERREPPDFRFNARIDQCRVGEVAAVHYPMRDADHIVNLMTLEEGAKRMLVVRGLDALRGDRFQRAFVAERGEA
jgi:hypothetical protein